MTPLEITYLMVEPLKEIKTGGEFYSQKIINYLESRGVVVDLFTLKDINEIGKNKTFISSNIKLIYSLLLKSKTNKIIVQDFYMHPWLFIFNWFARIFTNVKIVLFIQLFDYHFQKNRLLKFIDKLISAVALLPAHRAIVNSLTTAKGCERLGFRRGNIRVVYPGCDFAGVNYIKKDNNDGVVHLLAVSNYVPRKGLHFLIQAIALIKEKYPDVYNKLSLEITGDPDDVPSYIQKLQDLIRENSLDERVKLTGWKDRAELKELFLKSDIFIFTGIEEAFGMVLAEAMQFGLPIIAFSSGSASELVEHNKNGILIPPKNIELLAGAIRKLVLDSELRMKFGQTSRELSKKFVRSWEETGEQFYQAVMEIQK